MNEKLIERKLVAGVKKARGMAIKFTSPFFTGMPDRVVLLRNGEVRFAEIKTTGQQLSPRQKIVKEQLERMNIRVDVIDDEQSLSKFLKEIQ